MMMGNPTYAPCFLFIEVNFANKTGNIGLVTMHGWMFISSFNNLRAYLLNNITLHQKKMANFWYRTFSELNSKVVQTTAFVINKSLINNYTSVFHRVFRKEQALSKSHALANDMHGHRNQ